MRRNYGKIGLFLFCLFRKDRVCLSLLQKDGYLSRIDSRVYTYLREQKNKWDVSLFYPQYIFYEGFLDIMGEGPI